MNYIIDPSVFYWMNVLSAVHDAAFIIGIIFLVADAGLCFACMIDCEFKPYKKAITILSLIGFLFLLIWMFVPTKDTSIEMLIARTATFDNANMTVQQIKEIVDYVVGALKGI